MQPSRPLQPEFEKIKLFRWDFLNIFWKTIEILNFFNSVNSYCKQGQNCVNNIGSYTCHDGCSVGYSEQEGACIDINECEDGTHNCGISEECKNRPG